MKRLLIDVNSVVPYFVSGRINGIGRTTMELMSALASIPNLQFEIMLYSQNMKGIGGRDMNLPFKCRHLYLPNRPSVNQIISHFPVREIMTGYDLMHIPHNFEYLYHPEKCIITIHDALFMKMREKAFEHEKMKKLVPVLAAKCHHIVTCSEASKKDIVETMQINPDKISVIYWGIKHEIFKPLNLSKDDINEKLSAVYSKMPKKYFLSVSCNAERKRTHILIESYIKLCVNNPVNDLVLIWKNPPAWLTDRIASSPAKNRIHFISNISDENLALLYNGATASFTPSSYEGFGLPVLEAMACGTPVITCRNSSLEEIGGDAAIYAPEPVQESLYAIMNEVENNNICFDDSIKKGIANARKYTWADTANKTIEVYKHCLGI